jgi:uncharacterized membrane protein
MPAATMWTCPPGADAEPCDHGVNLMRNYGSGARPRDSRVVAVAIMLYIIAASVTAILRHAGLNSTGFDLAIQDQVLWQTAHGRWFQSSIEVEHYLGDHVSLIALAIAPLARLPGSGVGWLLIFQSVALGSAAWPLHRLARLETNSTAWAVAIPVAFLLFPPLGFINRFDFHFVALSIPCLMWMLLFLRQGRTRAAAVAAVLAILCREEVGVAVACAAAFYAFEPRRRRFAVCLAMGSIAWSVIALAVIIPYFRGEASDSLGRYAWLAAFFDAGPTEGASSRPALLSHVSDAIIRLKTLAFVFILPAALPILAPRRALCVLPPLLVCLLAASESQSSIYFHYLSPVIPLAWWAVVGGASRLAYVKPPALAPVPQFRRGLLAPVVLVACLLVAWLVENPIFKPVNYPYYPVQVFPPRENVEAFHNAATMIGPEDSVLATSAFAPHLSRREKIGIIGWASEVAQPDVVCLDISDFRWTRWSDDYAGELERLILSPDYGVAYWRDGVVLLRRGSVDRVDRAAVVAKLREVARAWP